jgi:hypothetical protein
VTGLLQDAMAVASVVLRPEFIFVLGALGCGGAASRTDGRRANHVFQGLTTRDPAGLLGNTSADVDVCPTICDFGVDGIFGDEVFEIFTQTHANAVFVNFGSADILLDTYTVSIPGSGLPPRTTNTAALLPGGRCVTQPTQHCGLDSDCGFGDICNQTEIPIEILLFDFEDKVLIVGDAGARRRPTHRDPDAGYCPAQTFQVNVTFSAAIESASASQSRAGSRRLFDANNRDSGSGE